MTSKTRKQIQRSLGAALVAFSCAAPAFAQDDPKPAHITGLGSTLTADFLADLPFGENVYAVLETTQAEVIADTFNSGGLNVGATARTAGFLGSWTQTRFRIGDVDITDTATGGSSLLFPELYPWQAINVRTGLMPAAFNAIGLGITLDPVRPGATWTRMVQSSGSGGGLAAKAPLDAPPPIARLQHWGQGAALFSGPVTPRLGVAAGGSWARSSVFAREVLPATEAERGSGFVHLVHTPSTTAEWRTLGWVQRTRVPLSTWQTFNAPDATTRDVAVHVQSTWEHRAADEIRWRVFGAHTGRSRSNDLRAPSSLAVERLEDGPVPAIPLSTGDSTVRRWTAGARIAPAVSQFSKHDGELGIDFDRSSGRTSGEFTGAVGERVDGLPARLWEFVRPASDSRRHVTSIGIAATDRIALSPVATLDAGIRLESIRGRSADAQNGVAWTTVLPHAALRWERADAPPVAFIAGYRRSANHLNMDWLAVGDPYAPTAIVSRWQGTPIPPAPGAPVRSAIVDLIGPGTGGNPNFTRIADGLKRPYTDEFVVGIESLRRGWLRVSMMGIARREANLVGLVDRGVPISSYSTIGIPDPGHDFFGTEDDQILTIYNRLPSTFARNQYVLDNPGQEAASSYAFKLAAEGSTERVFVLIGATAYLSRGLAASRGFLPIENDQDVLGDLFTNPNSATFARGRLFSDRAFTAKWTTVYRFPGDFHVGAIARYQDGQPFARFVLAQGLTQGPEVVRAYPNGGNRFTFTGTLDLRVKKGFTIGTGRVEGLLDVYNLFTRSNEVEEYAMTGPDFRTPTAIEPTPSVHLGLRVVF